MEKNKYSVIIPASGLSNRFGNDKLMIKINNIEIIKHTVSIFIEDKDCNHVIICANNKNIDKFKTFFHLYSKVLVVKGGKTRFESVKNGISYLRKDAENILIHDGARPFLNNELLSRIKQSVIIDNNSITIPYIDIYDSCMDISINKYLDRDNIKIIQTPQAFKRNLIVNIYNNVEKPYNDEYSMILDNSSDAKCNFVLGQRSNVKITTKEDLEFVLWEE